MCDVYILYDANNNKKKLFLHLCRIIKSNTNNKKKPKNTNRVCAQHYFDFRAAPILIFQICHFLLLLWPILFCFFCFFFIFQDFLFLPRVFNWFFFFFFFCIIFDLTCSSSVSLGWKSNRNGFANCKTRAGHCILTHAIRNWRGRELRISITKTNTIQKVNQIFPL